MGRTEIRAVVIEPSGTPVHNGTTVSFTTNLGTLLPGEARTTQWRRNGAVPRQWPVWNGNDQGDIRRCGVRGARTVGRCRCCKPRERHREPGVSALRRRNDDDLLRLSATQSGNPLFGVPVTFATTAGTFSSAVVNTDLSGTARTTLTTNQAASVTASAGGTTSAAVASFGLCEANRRRLRFRRTTPTEGGVTTLSVTITAAATGGSPIQSRDRGLRRRILRQSRIGLGYRFRSACV